MLNKFDISSWEIESIHVMIATGITQEGDEYVVQCKNTYRDDIHEPDLLEIPLKYGSKKGAGSVGWWLGSVITAFYISLESL